MPFPLGPYTYGNAAAIAAATPTPQSVTKFVGTGADDAAVGSEVWANPTNIQSDDASVASISSLDAVSHYLKGTMSGNLFAIPVGATIDGVIFSYQRSDPAQGVVTDLTVKLVKGGVVSGTNKADINDDWGAVPEVKTYGGAADLWGLALTAADVNAADFGVVLSADPGFGGGNPQVDYFSITIHYTA